MAVEEFITFIQFVYQNRFVDERITLLPSNKINGDISLMRFTIVTVTAQNFRTISRVLGFQGGCLI